MSPARRLYVGQKAFIELDGRVLVLFSGSFLDMPGGRIDEGEYDLTAALKREVREETSLEVEVGDAFVTWLFEPPDTSPFLAGYRCLYVSGEVTLSEEHTAYRWVDAQTFRELDDGSPTFRALARYFET
jgi:8-oxo-dGTP pyrophosphatase MutT (NUDIX family)